MRAAICTIQRNRAPWLEEWFSFHDKIGFKKFYFFAHKCEDNTAEVINKLKSRFEIEAFTVPDDMELPQLKAYDYAYKNFNHEFDWIAFIDGDEFLFSVDGTDIRHVLEEYSYYKLSALAVYWACFGSNGHLEEPIGNITSNYRTRPTLNFGENRHIKSLVMGRQGDKFGLLSNSHFFKTQYGTYDELMRPIKSGKVNNDPSHSKLRINHYCTQSRSYFLQIKKFSGAPDSNPNLIRQDSWWEMYDRNEEYDNSLAIYNFYAK